MSRGPSRAKGVPGLLTSSLLLLAGASAPAAPALFAQSAGSAATRLRSPLPPPAAGFETAPVGVRTDAPGTPPATGAGVGRGAGRVALYSLVLPGAGQLARSQRRWLGYAALEGLAWYLHLDRRDEGHDLRDAYRDLAWEVARRRTGPRVIDDFEYYERMGAWTSSGRWDVDPAAGGVQPETDPGTYNGAIWLRATEIFYGGDPAVGPGDPAWEQALRYYADHAYPPELLWDWSGTGDAPARFRGLVGESDDELREATVMLGLIAGNHLISAADAFVSARLEERTGGRVGGGLALVPGVPAGGAGSGGMLLLRLEVRP